MPPIYQSSTFAFRDVCTNAGYDYTRSGNPTRAALEEAIAQLEGGSGATCTTTGMAAVTLVLNLLPAGSHVLATVDCYGGTFRTLEHAKVASEPEGHLPRPRRPRGGEAGPRAGDGAGLDRDPLQPAAAAHRHRGGGGAGRARGALTVVDNTFLSPVLQRPFEHGADLVVHSTTKYLNGHSDVVGGAVVAAPGRTALLQRIQSMNNLLGTSQSPHDCFLVLRGLKTLLLRMKAHEAGAQRVAEFLAAHPQVAQGLLPGAAEPPAARAGEAAAGRLRRHAQLRAEARDARARQPRAPHAALVHPGREPGRGGEPGGPPGLDDPRLDDPRRRGPAPGSPTASSGSPSGSRRRRT